MQIIDVKRKRLSEWFTVVEKTVMLGGNRSVYHSIDIHNYASIIALNKKKEIILVEQFRPSVEKITLELPGGIFKKPDKPKATAVNELFEETGYKADGVVDQIACVDVDYGRLSNKAYCFFCKDVYRDINSVPEKGIKTLTLPINEVLNKIKMNKFLHSPHIGFILLAKLKNFF